MSGARLVLFLILVVSVLLLPGLASAGAPIHETNDFTFVDTNFCGQGIEVTVHVTNHLTFHERVHKGFLYFSTNFSGVDTITYEPTGKTVTVDYHAQAKDVSIVDNGDGTVTIQSATNGLVERVTLPDGTVLYSDRGRIVFESVVDLNGTPLNTSDDKLVANHGIVMSHGPHPQAASDFELFCEQVPDALTAP